MEARNPLRRSGRQWMGIGVVVIGVMVGRATAGRGSEAPTSPVPASPTSPPKTAPAKPDPFAVPDGSPEELLKYLDSLGELDPPGKDRETVARFSRNLGQAIVQATEKIFAAKPTENQAMQALQWKIAALEMLHRFGDAQAATALKALPDQLEKQGWPRLARSARAMILASELEQIETNDPQAFQALVERIKAHVSQGELGRLEISLVLESAFAAERIGTELAVRTYEGYAKVFSASPNKQIAALGAKMQGAARRLTLVGKPMELAGVTLDNQSLDWAKYRGKVVLVAFWATWCGPCREEIKNIQNSYRAYHDRGFEVVAISVDKDRDQLRQFLQQTSLPWIVLFDQALQTDQADKTMATAYGVMQIPQLILIGQDGNVIALDVRGGRLKKLLRGLLGDAELPKKASPSE